MKEIKDREKIFSWDGVKGEELIIRRMLYDDPLLVLKDYPKEKLRKLFLENIHRFFKENLSFWKLILEVNDEELEMAKSQNFRMKCKIWNY